MSYRVQGEDGKLYGPLSADQVRAWFRERWAHADTRLAPEGSEQWRPFREYPEFAELLMAPPSPPAVDPAALPAGWDPQVVLARDWDLSIRNCLTRGWMVVKCDFWNLMAAWLVIRVILFAIEAIPYPGGYAMSLLFGDVFFAGLAFFYLKKMRSEYAEFGMVFAGLRGGNLKPLILVGLISGLVIEAAALLACLPGVAIGMIPEMTAPSGKTEILTGAISRVIPAMETTIAEFLPGGAAQTITNLTAPLGKNGRLAGLILGAVPAAAIMIYLSVSYVFAFMLVLEKRMRPWQAMELSRKVIGRHWWRMFGVLAVISLQAGSGLLLCGVGVLLTGPIAFAALMVAYEDIFNPRS